MCIPAGVAAGLSLALGAMSTVMQIQAQSQARKAAKAQSQFDATVLRNNQTIAENAAVDAVERGRIAEGLKRSEVSQLIGIQRAALAGSGVEVGTGSALQVTTDTAGIGEFEAQVIRSNAEREAFDLRVRAMNLGAEAELTLLKGNRPDTTLTTALSGASSILGNFATFSQAGVFDPAPGRIPPIPRRRPSNL